MTVHFFQRLRDRLRSARVETHSPSDRVFLRPHASGLKSLFARYDAAQTNYENRRHWANADHLSANAAANVEVRRTLRSRARYEVANNSYAKGIVLTLANYVVGTGPRLQMLTDDPEANRVIEREFARWAKAISLPHKLRTMRIAQCESGEVFGLLATNPQIEGPVQLDLRLIEADQVASPAFGGQVDRLLDRWAVRRSGLPNSLTAQQSISLVDGIAIDEYGNPVAYYVLRRHPGDNTPFRAGTDYDLLPAEAVIHLYRAERPGQNRGIPEITPALPLFAMLRRYTLAVLGSAEQAALPSGVIYTDAPADAEASGVEPMDTVELDRGTWMTMPFGWKIGQVRAEQPTTAYPDFKHEIINEIARCLNMPFNIAAGNSSGYNYASGRLDHQAFFKSIRIDQSYLADIVLDRIFGAWLDEAVLALGLRLEAGGWRKKSLPMIGLVPQRLQPTVYSLQSLFLTSGSGTASSTSIRPRKPTRKPRGWRATQRRSPPSTPSVASIGRANCASGPARSR